MDALQQTPFTLCTTVAGMAAGTTTTLTTANVQLFSIKGKAYTKAATSNEATPTTDGLTGAAFVAIPAGSATAAYGCVFVICRNSAGALKVVQGPLQATDLVASGANSSFIVAPQLPAIPDTLCPIGYIVVKVGTSGSAWTFGTSNLTGPPSNVGIAYVDCMTLPDRPQVS